jgi:hypothetical protein
MEISALRGVPDPSLLVVVVGQLRVVATAPQSSCDKAGGPDLRLRREGEKKLPTAIGNLKLRALLSVDAMEIVEAVAWWCCGSEPTLALSTEKCCPSSQAYAPCLLCMVLKRLGVCATTQRTAHFVIEQSVEG